MSKPSQRPAIVEFFVFISSVLVLTVKVIFVTLFYCFWGLLPNRKRQLKDEIVLITGGGGGLGRELALKFSEHPVKIVLWDINRDALLKVAVEVEGKGGWIRTYLCDVTNENDVKATANKVREEVGDITLLVNNAGILQNRPIDQLDSGRIRKTFEVNVVSHFWTIREFLPKMLEKKKGHIVAISSIAGLFGQVNYTDYSASKFAVVGLMECLMEELRNKQMDQYIYCTTICPVTIETGMIHDTTTKHQWAMPILSAAEASEAIMTAIRKRKTLTTIPKRIIFLSHAGRVFPRKVSQLVLDFVDYCKVPNTPPDEKV